MSFVRPELAASATRLFHRYFTHWIESVVVLVIGGFGIVALVAGISQRGIPAIIVGAASLVVAGLAAVAFHRTALARRDPTAVGVVEVHEGRVMYLAPGEDGGSADVRELTRVEIVTTAGGPFEPDVFWVLTQPGQPLLTIPTEATGAGELFDALSALPGLSWEAVARAMGSTENARFLVWEKDPGDNRVVPLLRRLH
jgi:hypothetical protein